MCINKYPIWSDFLEEAAFGLLSVGPVEFDAFTAFYIT
jgi:hypothetical protein